MTRLTAGTPDIPTATVTAPPEDAGSEPPGGLTATQLLALEAARRDGRKITRAAGVATFSGWTLAVFAGITVLTGIFSPPSLLLGLGMAFVATMELRGAGSLRRLDPGAPRRLGLNQLAFGFMLCLYGGWGIFSSLTGPGHYDAEIAAGGQVAEMLEPIAALHTLIAVAVYGGVIAGGLIATGGAALYYFTRKRHLDAHLQRTPPWVIATLRTIEGGGELRPSSSTSSAALRAAI